MLLASALVAGLVGCGSSEPDAVSKLIAKRYSDCMPGLKAADIQRISDRRYSVMTDKYSAAWTVFKSPNTGDTLTPPAEDSFNQMERWGCM